MTAGFVAELETGIAPLDAQHRELFWRVTSLAEAARVGNLERAVDLLVYLERYAAEHFATEERWMEDAAYPDLAPHRTLHAGFRDTFEARRAEFEAGGSRVTLMLGLSQWLGAWLLEHVGGADAAFARYYRAVANARAAP